MKQFHRQKLIQVIILFVIAFFILGYVWQQRLLESSLLNGNPAWILCIIIWAYCILNFVFILLDIKQLKKNSLSAEDSPILYDPITKLPNRTACDIFLSNTKGQVLPENMGLVMVRLDNLEDTNQTDGYIAGNHLLTVISDILSTIAKNSYFVARNGSDIFAILIPDCVQANIDEYALNLKNAILGHNESTPSEIILYSLGSSIHTDDAKQTINGLFSEAYANLKEIV